LSDQIDEGWGAKRECRESFEEEGEQYEGMGKVMK